MNLEKEQVPLPIAEGIPIKSSLLTKILYGGTVISFLSAFYFIFMYAEI
jgi:heme exporter protein C